MNKLVSFLQSWYGLITALVVIVVLNSGLFLLSNATSFSEVQKREGASGFRLHYAAKFSYFHYYTGYFPLASLNEDLLFSKEAAISEIEEHGENLVMEAGHWYRLGENARIFTLLPSAYINKSTEYVSVKPFNAFFFTVSLLVLFFGFWQIKYALQGLLLVFLLNFTPFFLYEIYTHENIFALLGSAFFFLLGANMNCLFSDSYNKYFLLLTSGVSAVTVGFLTEIRNEISVVILSLMLILAFAKKINGLTKAVYIAFVFLLFIGTKQSIRVYFEREFQKTKTLVEAKGGHVYEGKTIPGHLVWHPIFCGLGDFDTKYGYEYEDHCAYEYAIPVMKEKYGVSLRYSGGFYADEYYDDAQVYYNKIEENPEYEIVIREKVLSDVLGDPLWYLNIFIKRVYRVLSVTLPVPYLGLLIFPLIYYIWKRRQWVYLKLLLIAFPCSLTPLIVYSGGGSTYNSTFVYLIIVIVLMLMKDAKSSRG